MDRPIGRLPPRKQPLPPLARSDAPLPSPPSDLGPPEANLKGTRTGEGERAPASRGREAVQLPKHSAQALNADLDARGGTLPPSLLLLTRTDRLHSGSSRSSTAPRQAINERSSSPFFKRAGQCSRSLSKAASHALDRFRFREHGRRISRIQVDHQVRGTFSTTERAVRFAFASSPTPFMPMRRHPKSTIVGHRLSQFVCHVYPST